jgi:CHASE2 domain-containing sensor protein
MSRLPEWLQKIVLPARPHEPFGKVLRHQLPVLVAFSLLTLALEHMGWLNAFESFALDSLVLFRGQKPPSNVMIVTIDDQDYRELFGGRSPLDADKLRQVLAAIAAGQPKAIGVDLENSDPRFADDSWPRAVWARDGYVLEHDGGHGAQQIVRLPILGGRFTEHAEGGEIATDPPSGLVLYPRDHDGVVRRYQRYFHSPRADPPSDLTGEVDSLPWAIAKQYARAMRAASEDPCPECERIESLEKQAGADALVLNFAGEQYRFNRLNVRNLLTAASKDYWAENSPLRDTIVILGGTYRAARDEYITPVGPRYGVELVAQAVASELQGGGIRTLNWILATAMDMINGLILIYLNWRFPGSLAGVLNIAAIIVMSIVGSLVAFGAVAYWFNFSAVLVGLWIDILWHQAHERRHLRAELEQLRRAQGSAAH